LRDYFIEVDKRIAAQIENRRRQRRSRPQQTEAESDYDHFG
jgi:hypothetical protein